MPRCAPSRTPPRPEARPLKGDPPSSETVLLNRVVRAGSQDALPQHRASHAPEKACSGRRGQIDDSEKRL